MSTVKIDVLGQFRIEYRKNSISDDVNRSKKMWNLLAFIVMNHEISITQSKFIDALWSDDNTNPINTLKTQLFRTREMLKPLGLDGERLILSQRGAYSWNPDIELELDAALFEDYVRQAGDTGKSTKERTDLYYNALKLYKGDFIPKLSGEAWTIPISARYHGLYIDTVKKLCALLEDDNNFEAIIDIILKAITIDNLDEDLHCLLINAYIRCDRHKDALNHYDSATSLLYKNLGVNPSENLRALYHIIMDTQKSLETDLAIIQEHLMENYNLEGAFVCEYGYFVKTYQLTKKRLERLGLSTYLCLITIQDSNGKTPGLQKLDIYMNKMLSVLNLCLRTGDVVARYSGAQYILMLPCLNFENAEMVMNRILSNYKKRFRTDKVIIAYKIKEI